MIRLLIAISVAGLCAVVSSRALTNVASQSVATLADPGGQLLRGIDNKKEEDELLAVGMQDENVMTTIGRALKGKKRKKNKRRRRKRRRRRGKKARKFRKWRKHGDDSDGDDSDGWDSDGWDSD